MMAMLYLTGKGHVDAKKEDCHGDVRLVVSATDRSEQDLTK